MRMGSKRELEDWIGYRVESNVAVADFGECFSGTVVGDVGEIGLVVVSLE